MEFKFRGIDTQRQHNQMFHTSPSSSTSNYTYFSQQAVKGLWSERSVGGGQVTDVLEMRDAVYRELEKERIRSEIVTEEIERQSVLVAEVRREMMMEREMMNGGRFLSSFISPPPPRSHHCQFEPEMLHGESFSVEDRRIAMPRFPETYGGGGGHRFEIGGFEAVPIQRFPRSPRVEEIITSQRKHGTNEIIGLGKSYGATVCRSKRKPPPSPPAGAGSSGRCSNRSNKKIKAEWSCAVCEITATSEHSLNGHLSGKKHVSKMAALKADNKNGAEIGHGKFKNSTNCISTNSKEDKKTEGKNTRKKSRFWCKMCRVEAQDEQIMSKHKVGKKHLKNLKKTRAKNKTYTR